MKIHYLSKAPPWVSYAPSLPFHFLATILILLACPLHSHANVLTLDLAADGTWTYNTEAIPAAYYGTSGIVQAGTEDGAEGTSITWRNYYILDLSGLTDADTITSITAQFPTVGVDDESLPEYDFSLTNTSPAVLEGSGTTSTAFDSLSGGTLLGQAYPTPDGSSGFLYTLTITGNANFVDFLNENLGNVVAIAGSKDRLSAGHMGPGDPIFTVTTVPEPNSATLFSFAAVGSFFFFRKRRTSPSRDD